jgi:hypothetical protein
LSGPRKCRALSFGIHTTDGQELKPEDLREIVRALPGGMRGVFTSVNLFHVYTRDQLAPYYTSDDSTYYTADAIGTLSTTPEEILESAVFPDVATLDTVDFWRTAPRGFASHIRTFNEDRQGMRDRRLEPGKWLWPFYLVRELYEFVLHACLLSERFEKAESVQFHCEWWGLCDRELADAMSPLQWTSGKIAKTDHRVVMGEWATEDLHRTPDVVSELAGPILRLFDPSFECSAEWVGEQTKRFRG